MAWSSRREGMVLEVAGIPDELRDRINDSADEAGGSFDAHLIALLERALGAPPRAGRTAPRPVNGGGYPLTLYVVEWAGNRPLTVKAERARETAMCYRLASTPNAFGATLLRKSDGFTTSRVGFTPREAVEKFIADTSEWKARYERRLGDEDVQRDPEMKGRISMHVAQHQRRIEEARALLSTVDA